MMQQNDRNAPDVGVGSLFRISFPLILALLSTSMMMILDRYILAHYSEAAMSAVSLAGTWCIVFHFGSIEIVSITEVFVGQWTGAGRTDLAAKPVWQMIWVSLASSLVFIPIGILGADLFVPAGKYAEMGASYFRWMMIFGPAFLLTASLDAYFIGRGQTKIVTVVSVLANVLNIILDILFVFGWKDVIPEMGAMGAAFATGISQVLAALLLFTLFYRQRVRDGYGAEKKGVDWPMMSRVIRLGLPNSIGNIVEYTGWAVLMRMMGGVSDLHLTVFAVGHSFFLLFSFSVTDGIQAGVTHLASNTIGAGHWDRIPTLFISSIKLLLMAAVVLAIPMLIYPGPLVNEFLSEYPESAGLAGVRSLSVAACFWVWVFFVFDGIVWILSGIFASSGDTKFFMVMNTVTVWLFAILPVYLFVVEGGGSPVASWKCLTVYGFLNFLCFWCRYRSRDWKKSQIV
jgi:MATE family multidrug resistance protein